MALHFAYGFLFQYMACAILFCIYIFVSQHQENRRFLSLLYLQISLVKKDTTNYWCMFWWNYCFFTWLYFWIRFFNLFLMRNLYCCFYFCMKVLLEKEVLNCPIFNNLKKLILGGWSMSHHFELVAFFLRSPYLQRLTLYNHYVSPVACTQKDTHAHINFTEPHIHTHTHGMATHTLKYFVVPFRGKE